MSHVPSSVMMFAVAQDGRAVHIDEVPNGAKCECRCPACLSPLIAKNGGEERAHHFAHEGRVEDQSCAETALHLAAKQIVADNKKVMLPGATIWSDSVGSVIEFNEVILEHRLGTDVDGGSHIVADCMGISGAQSIIIEIAVHHQVDLIKLGKIQTLNIQSIEISLTDYADRAWDWETLTQEVLFSGQRRKWLWQPESASAEQTVEAAPSSFAVATEQKEWTFLIGGHWVWVKKLPFGNIKVFHRPSDYVRKIVQPLCQNRGFWNPKFKCWVVFDQFKDDILKSLSESGRLYP